MESNGGTAAGSRFSGWGKPVVTVGSAIIGAGLAAVAGWAIYSSSTSAPSTNPANQPVVVYGDR